jgi:hypothetical protein
MINLSMNDVNRKKVCSLVCRRGRAKKDGGMEGGRNVARAFARFKY